MKFVDKLGKNSYVIWDSSDLTSDGWGVAIIIALLILGIPYLIFSIIGWLCY